MSLRNQLKDQRGYTLVELIAAMTIFAIISVVVLGALVTVIQSSTKVSAERKVQQDARYSIEAIARQTRSASIDYAFYTQNAGDARCAFSPAGSNSTKTLALLFTQAGEANAPATQRLIFFYSNNAIWRYQNSASTPTPTCTGPSSIFAAASGAQQITATDVTVTQLAFYISPNQNPYDQTTCPVGSAADCNIARNTHPRVTILMTAQSVGAGVGVSQQAKTGTTTVETTVGSRAYPIKTLLGQPAT